jgi:hypothetical protein
MSVPKKYSHIDFTPPAGARKAAKRALAWREEYGRGGTDVGVARARDISNGERLSPDTVMRMHQFFARHGNHHAKHYKIKNGEPSTWRIAWDLWGGDDGRSWANKIVKQMYAADEKE